MKKHTIGYKEQIKEMGRELNSIITFGETVLGSEELNAVTPSFQSSLLKSAMKQLDIDSNVEIPVGTILNYKFGTKVNGEYEYIDYGNYVVKEVEKQEDTLSYKITCYDKMLYSMKDYTKLDIEYPINIRDYISALCNHLGLAFANNNEQFSNYDKIIPNELFLDENGNSLGYTFRDVFDELSQVTGSNICINDSDEVEIRYINETNDTIDEEFFKNINVNFGQKYGPINSIVLSRAGESDNIYLRDEESVEINGLCELKIKENQIMNFNNRNEFLQDIFNKLNGIEFYLNDFTSTGITYYELCDKYNVSIGDKIYPCVMFNDETLITQGLEENIYTEMLEESETDYTKADKTDRKINQTYIIANKQKGEIESLTSQVKIINTQLNDVYTIEQTNRLIQNAETGVTNTFSEAGGNNVFRNTGLWFINSGEDAETNPYEFWEGKANKGDNAKATNYKSIKLVKGSFIQDAEVPNGKYSISFYYRKLISNAIASVVINDKEYSLDSLEEEQFYTGEQDSETGEYIVDPLEVTNNHIKIEFKCDAVDGLEVYDLMCNKGAVKLAYSQNQNETTTDTVNISRGITITSSVDENTKFKADYDGIRVLDKNNSVKTKFTDKGTETDELVVRKKATITGLLQQEVDDQTWVTKI